MYVYIAGPLTQGHRMNNIRCAIDAAEKIASKGHVVFIPHLWDFWQLVYGNHDYEFWMNLDISWIKRCDVLVRIPGTSPGSDREETLARGWGKIVYGSVNTDGVQAFMNSEHWCKTENNANYSSPILDSPFPRLEKKY